MTSIPPRDRKPKSTDAEIYRDYVVSKASDRGIGDLLLKHGISRSNLYNIVGRVRDGNQSRIKRDVEKARFAALWEHKYQARFLSIPKNRNAETVVELRALIRDMQKDGFSQLLTSTLLGKDRSTVIHHLTH